MRTFGLVSFATLAAACTAAPPKRSVPDGVDAAVTGRDGAILDAPGSGSGPGSGDPTAQWDLVVGALKFSQLPGNVSWDPNGAADPYVVVTVNGHDYKTDVLANQTLTATWNQNIGTVRTADLKVGGNGYGEFSLAVLDRDLTPQEHVGSPETDPSYPNDDEIGSIGSLTPWDGLEHEYNLSFAGVTAVVTFTIAAHP